MSHSPDEPLPGSAARTDFSSFPMNSPLPSTGSRGPFRSTQPVPASRSDAGSGSPRSPRKSVPDKPTRQQVCSKSTGSNQDLWQRGPRAILAYLERGDPLGIAAVAGHLAARRRWWIGFEQALPRVRAEVALRASRGRGQRPSAGEVRGWCEAGLRAWLEDPNTRHLPAPHGRCPGFAQLPFEARDAFFRVFVEGANPDRVATELSVDLSTLGRHVRAVLDHLAPPSHFSPTPSV